MTWTQCHNWSQSSRGTCWKEKGRNKGRHEEVWEGGVNRWVQLAERSAHLSLCMEELSLSLSPRLHPIIHLHTCKDLQQHETRWVDRLDLHTTPVHLDDLGSQSLDGSQYQLLVLQGSDAKAQYISVNTRFTEIRRCGLIVFNDVSLSWFLFNKDVRLKRQF